METKAPFDLNAAIQRWRENLAQSPAFRAENIAELESHLRDSIARLQTTGLSADEAFMVAEKRIGREGVLEAEYQKINVRGIWLERLFWMLIGIQLLSFVADIVSVGRDALYLGLARTSHNFSGHSLLPPTVLLAVVNLAQFAAAVAAGWWLLRRKGVVIKHWTEKLLSRRVSGILTFCAVFLVSNSVRLAEPFYFRVLALGKTSTAMGVVFSGAAISSLIQMAALLGLTLYLAAKRSRPVRA